MGQENYQKVLKQKNLWKYIFFGCLGLTVIGIIIQIVADSTTLFGLGAFAAIIVGIVFLIQAGKVKRFDNIMCKACNIFIPYSKENVSWGKWSKSKKYDEREAKWDYKLMFTVTCKCPQCGAEKSFPASVASDLPFAVDGTIGIRDAEIVEEYLNGYFDENSTASAAIQKNIKN